MASLTASLTLSVNGTLKSLVGNIPIDTNLVHYVLLVSRAMATIEVPSVGEGEHIQIGWIQTCTHMQFINTYGREGV